MEAAIKQNEKLLDIECLRALAIGFTVLAHCRFMFIQQPRWIEWMDARINFASGVDLFFVISGFVIAKNLIPKLKGDDALPRVMFDFWLRRVYRLLPSAWLWAFIGLGIVAIANRPAFGANFVDVIASILEVYNFHAYSCQVGHALCGHQAVGVYWSLSLEEQFYILLPPIIFFFRARAKWVILALLIAGIATTFWAPIFSMFSRWDGFCYGVLLAWLYQSGNLHKQMKDRLLSKLGLILPLGMFFIVVAMPVIMHGSLVIAVYPMTALCSAFLVTVASFDENYFALPKPLRWIGVWLGARSYAIYLAHVPVFLLMNKISGGNGQGSQSPIEHAAWLTAAIIIILIVSDTSFRTIETRFRLRSSI
jgi:peptidoglycan/LPS O-acetylase OafA/YrhL